LVIAVRRSNYCSVAVLYEATLQRGCAIIFVICPLSFVIEKPIFVLCADFLQ
jgi:hypothetical protein